VDLGLEQREVRYAIGQESPVGAEIAALVGAASDGPSGLDDREPGALRCGFCDAIRLPKRHLGDAGCTGSA
jgi:hypothetical protein